MLVVMAVLTTIMTEPLLRLVYPDKMLQHDIAEAERAALGTMDAFRVLALIAGDGNDETLVDTAAEMIGDEAPAELVLTSFSEMRRGHEVGAGIVQELGQMATVLERLKVLSRRAQARAVPSVVRSQFSDDIGADLVAQAAAVEADIVLVPLPSDDGAALFSRLLREVAGELVLVVDPHLAAVPGAPQGPVVVVVTEGPNGAAALEMGARVAFSRQSPLVLISENSSRKLVRHAADRAEELARRLDCRAPARGEQSLEEVLAAAGAGLIIMAADDAGPAGARHLAAAAGAPVMLVRAAAADDGRGLERWLKRSDPTSA
jgi:hypothetical protein